jgi:hypothetical protein
MVKGTQGSEHFAVTLTSWQGGRWPQLAGRAPRTPSPLQVWLPQRRLCHLRLGDVKATAIFRHRKQEVPSRAHTCWDLRSALSSACGPATPDLPGDVCSPCPPCQSRDLCQLICSGGPRAECV